MEQGPQGYLASRLPYDTGPSSGEASYKLPARRSALFNVGGGATQLLHLL